MFYHPSNNMGLFCSGLSMIYNTSIYYYLCSSTILPSLSLLLQYFLTPIQVSRPIIKKTQIWTLDTGAVRQEGVALLLCQWFDGLLCMQVLTAHTGKHTHKTEKAKWSIKKKQNKQTVLYQTRCSSARKIFTNVIEFSTLRKKKRLYIKLHNGCCVWLHQVIMKSR